MFCVQVLTYGPNTWLPSMTADMGFVGMQGAWALMLLQIGAGVGTYIGSRLADRGSPIRTIVPYFVFGAVSFTALAFGSMLGVVGISIASFFTGFSIAGPGSMMYGVIASHYPVSSRGSAIGFCVGVSRFGAILGPQIGAFFTSPRPSPHVHRAAPVSTGCRSERASRNGS
ncbi:MAG: MFS transporter [Burkholderiaceae bacterium]